MFKAPNCWECGEEIKEDQDAAEIIRKGKPRQSSSGPETYRMEPTAVVVHAECMVEGEEIA